MDTAKVIASGNSAVVVLPKRFRDSNGISIGDSVLIDYPTQGTMVIRAQHQPQSNRLKAYRKLVSLLSNRPSAPTPSPLPETRSDLRDELESRYV